MSSDPIRLLAESELTPAEQRVLEAGQVDAPADYDFARGEAQLRASLGPLGADSSTHGSRPGASAAKIWNKPVFKVVLGLTAGMVASYVALSSPLARPRAGFDRASQHESTRETHTVTARATPAVPQPVVTPLFPDPQQPRDSRAGVREQPGPGSANVPRKRSVEARGSTREQDTLAAPTAAESLPLTSVTPNIAAEPGFSPLARSRARLDEGVDPRAELRAIAQAKAMSERDPRAALVLLEQIRTRFSQGYFVEEREALTILALARTGQLAAARGRAGTFLAQYPNGPHSDRVREAVSAR